jgi:hypothetical protein
LLGQAPDPQPHIGTELEKDVNRLRSITNREYEHRKDEAAHGTCKSHRSSDAAGSCIPVLLTPMNPLALYVMEDTRHNNDFTDIRDIRIAPTHDELLCPIPPYLPVFLPVAPHHLPENSMQRHLDIQFRL